MIARSRRHGGRWPAMKLCLNINIKVHRGVSIFLRKSEIQTLVEVELVEDQKVPRAAMSVICDTISVKDFIVNTQTYTHIQVNC